jgi:hypothetical protein
MTTGLNPEFFAPSAMSHPCSILKRWHETGRQL